MLLNRLLLSNLVNRQNVPLVLYYQIQDTTYCSQYTIPQ